MGWDTQVTIIAQNTQGACFNIARLIYEQERSFIHDYAFKRVCYQEQAEDTVLFFTYERRKYIPYWVIQDISANHKEVEFTIVADSPDFLAGPGGLVRIRAGEIYDSYGFWDKRQDLASGDFAETPDYVDPDLLFHWFGKGKTEELIRQRYTEGSPMYWCDGNYVNNPVDFNDEELAGLEAFIKRWKEEENKARWKDFSLAALEAGS